MKKPIPKIRVFGQRSIASSFLNLSSIPVDDPPENPSEKVENCSKLNKPVLFKPNNTEERLRPFTSLVSSRDRLKSLMERKAREERKNGDGGLEKMMLQQFKPRETQVSEEVSRDVTGEVSLESLDQTAAEETDHMAAVSTEINEDIIVRDDKTSKKRKDPFEGLESTSRTGKPVIVFGDNSKVSKPMQRERERGSNNNSKKQRSTYNHYANGSGWWDCDMEGVDSEEVGHSEVWEGVGSTTFGDVVDWH
ncbi:hypothetical protein ISN45_Aa07g030110 [Arabidopsis thaliana x Arabidopsis arenosa]|uniref:Uncharacterized protein n=1 Tax=Arabidopsis thaliana x Arabidopsis arenosa TaxID=1240361 RepID=A0A8T1Y8S4_9BRAS|nr:hypothetical protein ISN45_Aa07g030110 [Arabidopsis thaliana x Arabidopsis arenosa]